jgi:3-methyl-2-oxobutanoate hydroxymethyltransferase
MPFMSYHLSCEQALENAGRFLKEGGANAVKLEGGIVVADKVKNIVNSGIPVMGHIGLIPQSVNQLGGYKVQGKTRESAQKLLDDARALEKAGAFAVVLETVPYQLAKTITHKINIPTIGIGAGKFCSGQVQVISDMFGLHSGFLPKHAKRYTNLTEIMSNVIKQYCNEVEHGIFPSETNSFNIDDNLIKNLK